MKPKTQPGRDGPGRRGVMLTSAGRASTRLAGKTHPTPLPPDAYCLPSTEQASISMYYTAAVSKETQPSHDFVTRSILLSLSLSPLLSKALTLFAALVCWILGKCCSQRTTEIKAQICAHPFKEEIRRLTAFTYPSFTFG